jgi:putative transcriptional regulator
MHFFQGYFLVAAPSQLDPNFVGAVILVCGHNKRGAFGVILNEAQMENGRRRSRSRGNKKSSAGTAKLVSGGPVTGPLMAIHTCSFLGEWKLLPGVFFSRTEKNVLRLFGRRDLSCRIFAGYAGWGPGQLDYEVKHGVWRVVPASLRQIFSPHENLWEQLNLQASRMQFLSMIDVPFVPGDPLLN